MGAGEGRDDLLLPLVQMAEQTLTARLKPGITAEDCGAAFPLAVAMTAVAGLEGMEGEVSSFTAGDVTVRRGGGHAAALTARAEGLLAPWLKETGFAFRGVMG
jgi:hypothetical protein